MEGEQQILTAYCSELPILTALITLYAIMAADFLFCETKHHIQRSGRAGSPLLH